MSESLFITASCTHNHDDEKRTQQNLFICSDKSEAKITNDRRLWSTNCTTEAHDRHKTSYGFSAIAELLVGFTDMLSSTKLMHSALCYHHPSVHMSGWLSIIRGYCVKMAKPIIKICSVPWSAIILVFLHVQIRAKFWQSPHEWGHWIHVGIKICNFRSI